MNINRFYLYIGIWRILIRQPINQYGTKIITKYSSQFIVVIKRNGFFMVESMKKCKAVELGELMIRFHTV